MGQPATRYASLASVQADPRGFLTALYHAAVAAADPMRSLAGQLPGPPGGGGRTLVLGAGKAGGAMAQAVDAAWPADAPLSGLVITRYGHVPPVYAERLKSGRARIEVVEAAHPVPDEAGLHATRRLMGLAQGLRADDLVLCLISGGGSALLSAPAEGLTLADKQGINRALLMSGAAIGEMNCVRKHLSAVKGGRLAALCWPARVVTLTISDVPGDDPAVIASGPTVPDPSTCADALAILERYRIDIPPAARAGLARGAFETPKPDDGRFAGHVTRMVATPRMSLNAAAAMAEHAELNAYVLGDDLEGESRDVGQVHAALARAVATQAGPRNAFKTPCVLLSGGETTVTVRKEHGPPGHGGRAAEFALACATALQSADGIWGLAADTDGIDGTGPHAGALFGPDTLARAQAAGLKPAAALAGHDAAGLFGRLGDLLTPGPTFTNVNDFRALLVM
jgi:hydroxypyruvate reductase